MKTLYNKPNYVETMLDESLKCIIVTWLNLSNGDIVTESCLAQLEEVKKGATVIIVDTYEARSVPPQDVQDWFGTTLFPAYSKAGLKAIITVIPKRPTTRLGAKRWKETGKLFEFTMYETETLHSAKELAIEIQNN